MGWNQDSERALRAYLRAVIFAEPLQFALIDKYGVRLADLKALRVLRDLGEVPISVLADALGLSRSAATGLADRLERRGLLYRRPFPEDRRVTRVGVTELGVIATEDRDLYRHSVVGQRIAALSPEDQRRLADVLERLTAVDEPRDEALVSSERAR